MKRNLIYSVFAAILLASCSSDDIAPVPVPAPETLDAYISLGITNGTVKTKADADADGDGEKPDTSYGDGGVNQDPAGTTAINSFTVAIFRGALSATAAADGIVAPVTEPEGSLIYLNTFKTDNLIDPTNDAEASKLCAAGVVGTADGKNYQINGIKVKAGNLRIIVMANMPDGFPKNVSAEKFMEQYYSNLANEGFNKKNESKTYPCSMSSKWLEVKIDPTAGEDASANLNNKVYYLLNSKIEEAKETTGDGVTGESNRTFSSYTATEAEMIPLYRNVSAVGFQNITLAPADGWGKKGGATLKLKSVFVANAIGSTSLIAGEVPGEDYIFYSGYNGVETVANGYKDDTNGALAANNTKMLNLNCSDFGNQTSLTAGGEALSSVSYHTDISEGHKSVGKYFMVYENSLVLNPKLEKDENSDNRTLLILCADYEYTDDLGVKHPLNDRYYAIVVNDEKSSTITGSGANQLVQRNYIYKINLTIVGPGSINPYDPLYTANATAFVEAAPWEGAIDITQEAE